MNIKSTTQKAICIQKTVSYHRVWGGTSNSQGQIHDDSCNQTTDSDEAMWGSDGIDTDSLHGEPMKWMPTQPPPTSGMPSASSEANFPSPPVDSDTKHSPPEMASKSQDQGHSHGTEFGDGDADIQMELDEFEDTRNGPPYTEDVVMGNDTTTFQSAGFNLPHTNTNASEDAEMVDVTDEKGVRDGDEAMDIDSNPQSSPHASGSMNRFNASFIVTQGQDLLDDPMNLDQAPASTSAYSQPVGETSQSYTGSSASVMNSHPDDISEYAMDIVEPKQDAHEQSIQNASLHNPNFEETRNAMSTEEKPTATDARPTPRERVGSDCSVNSNEEANVDNDSDDDLKYTNARPMTRMVQLWRSGQIVDNPDFSANLQAGLPPLESIFGRAGLIYREVDMDVYGIWGGSDDNFISAQSEIPWFDSSRQVAELGSEDQSADGGYDGDGDDETDEYEDEYEDEDEDEQDDEQGEDEDEDEAEAEDGDDEDNDIDENQVSDEDEESTTSDSNITIVRPRTHLIELQNGEVIDNPDYYHSRKKGVKKVATRFGAGMLWRKVDADAYAKYGPDSIEFKNAQSSIPWFDASSHGNTELSSWDEDSSKESDFGSVLSDPPDDDDLDATAVAIAVDRTNEEIRKQILRQSARQVDSDSDGDQVKPRFPARRAAVRPIPDRPSESESSPIEEDIKNSLSPNGGRYDSRSTGRKISVPKSRMSVTSGDMSCPMPAPYTPSLSTPSPKILQRPKSSNTLSEESSSDPPPTHDRAPAVDSNDKTSRKSVGSRIPTRGARGGLGSKS